MPLHIGIVACSAEGASLYPKALAARGLDFVRPPPDGRAEMNRIIMDELVRSEFRAESVTRPQRIIARLKDDGCDAVVLGCTELPLVLDGKNAPLPVLDSTRELARAALRRACV